MKETPTSTLKIRHDEKPTPLDPLQLLNPLVEVLHLTSLTSDSLTNLEDLALSTLLQGFRHFLDHILRDDDDHSDTAVERTSHLVRVDVTLLHQPTEHGREPERSSVDGASNSFR